MGDVYWRGDAPDVSEIATFTFGGTWSTSDEITITVNSKDVVLTVGTTTTTAQVAQEVYNVLTGDALGAGYAVNTKDLPPEFIGSEFDEGSSVVTITGPAGEPLSVTMTENSVSGTIAKNTTQSATGSRYADNDQNWSTGTAPTTGDVAIFSEVDTDCSYGLSQLADVDALTREASYGGRIGLPTKNDESGEYYETSDQYVTFSGATNVTIGSGPGAQSLAMTRLDFDGNGGTVTVLQTGGRLEADIPPLDIVNLTSGTVNITSGEVWLRDCTTCTVNVSGSATVYMTGSITTYTQAAGTGTAEGAVTTLNLNGGTFTAKSTIGTANAKAGTLNAQGNVTTAKVTNATCTFDGTVGTLTIVAGAGTFNGNVTTATQTGGTTTFYANATTFTQHGGTSYLMDACASTTTTVAGGTCNVNTSGTIATLSIDGTGTVDCRTSPTAITITNPVDLYGTGCKLLDPYRNIGSLVVDLNGANPSQVDRGVYNRITYGTPA